MNALMKSMPLFISSRLSTLPVHDACEMSPIIKGTKFIKKQYNLNLAKDCRWQLWLIKLMTWKGTHHDHLSKWWFCRLVWGKSNLWSMNCCSLITLVKTVTSCAVTEELEKILLDFVHEQTPAWEEAYKEAHSRNQVHQAGTNGCSLDGAGRVDPYLVLDSTRMGGHPFSVLTCLSHSTNASSWFVIHMNFLITHQRIFWNGLLANPAPSLSQEAFPDDRHHETSGHHLCFISKFMRYQTHTRKHNLVCKHVKDAVFETKGIILSNS